MLGGGARWPGWEQDRRKPLVFTEIKGFQVASWAVISRTLPGFVPGEAERRRQTNLRPERLIDSF